MAVFDGKFCSTFSRLNKTSKFIFHGAKLFTRGFCSNKQFLLRFISRTRWYLCIDLFLDTIRKYSQFIVKIKAFFLLPLKALSKQMDFFMKISPSIFQWNTQWIHFKRSCESVFSSSLLFFLFPFSALNSKVSPRSIILWRYLNVSFAQPFRFSSDFLSSSGWIKDKANKDSE